MKICTITCHDVYNHGASLQAYALMTYLERCGHEVEIIDYKPDYLSNHYNLLSVDNPKWDKNLLTKLIYLALKMPVKIPSLIRKKAFDQFTSKYLKLTKIRYSSNEELKKNPPYANAYLCGSDQIWNSLHQNGKDPAFYLDFVPPGKLKASYAASFATDTLVDEILPFVKKKVERLDGIGVREKSGVEILKRLDIINAVSVVDPVLLLDKKDWNILGGEKFVEKYILIYDFDNSDLIRKLTLEIANECGYKIYTINPGKINYADRYFKFVGPETFISLIRDAAFVISNSYHAAVFSIIYQKKFAIVNRKESINTRMRDFLSDLKLNQRLVDEDYNLNEILKMVNYSKSVELLNEKIIFSMKYLDETLLSNVKVRNVL
ncbi:polysaccharide pyruvyl transferase family protein [Fictibacillus halophilus]|uniref:polysaccharide pyruvyl transferase family protein n=1 Tax=Fictibacillus halophilus TaxID=1610490 RepID=UPI00363FF2C1